MASQKSREAKKSSNKAKQSAKPVNKESSTSKKTKQEKNNKRSNNGTVSESEDLVIPSSSSDSQNQEDEPKQSTKSKKSKKEEQEDDDEEEEKKESKMCRFPMRRIKTIARSESSDLRISQEALFLLNKASEKFLEKFCEDAYACSVKDRKKSVGYKQLSSVVSKRRRYDFLSDFVPETIKAEDALAERKSAGT